MFIFRYIKTLLISTCYTSNRYWGMLLIGIGLWGFYATDEGTCTNLNIELCAASAIDVLKPAIFCIFRHYYRCRWYFTELQPKSKGRASI